MQNSTTANPRPLYHARHSRRICRRCSSKLYAQFNRDVRNVVIIETRRCRRYQWSWKLDDRDSICCECTLSLSDTCHSHMYEWLERLCSEQSYARGEGSICQGCAWVRTKWLWMTILFLTWPCIQDRDLSSEYVKPRSSLLSLRVVWRGPTLELRR